MRHLSILGITCLVVVLVTGIIACDSDSDCDCTEPVSTEETISITETPKVEQLPDTSEIMPTETIEEIFVSDLMLEGAAPWTSTNFANDSEDFQFAIVSDRAGIHRPGVFAGAMDQLNLLQPEFVINIGDLIEGYTEDEVELNKMWEEVDGMIDSLEMPFFRVVGNHDMGNDFMRQDWLNRYGKDYYHFVYKNALFLCISTEDPPSPLPIETLEQLKWFMDFMENDPEAAVQMALDYYGNKSEYEEDAEDYSATEVANISNEQVEYFLNVIEENQDVRWTYVFLHKPAWREEYQSSNYTTIVQALGDRPYTVFAGHEHKYQYEEIGGRDHIILGATGGLMKGAGPAYIDHISWVTMSDDGPEISNLKLDGIFGKMVELDDDSDS